MQIKATINKLEDYKYNAVNGNWTTARLIDDDIFGQTAQKSPEPIRKAIQKVTRDFQIISRREAIRRAWQDQNSTDPSKRRLADQHLQKLNQHSFPWVYIRHDGYAYPLVKNILWNVLNQIEINLKKVKK